ncbi:NAD(P)-dependent oxidoreductase [Halorussus salilacus]|uniref:NAD-dependent epimerase/dehydratase family protein n=1 Tax=Halorussus salilacus TaxID=2953750 RepID=UPI00209C9959|nr:NAD(P)-dependent oxidoreductase [Halorussus salilacus]USZ68251.1 NAD(P)-dependent oxidoreductase [Halorussus salilacus]
MDVLLTGAHGTVGSAITDHLDREFTLLDREQPGDGDDGRESRPDYDTVVADVTDYDAIRPAFDGQDAVVHLAGYPSTDGSWPEVLENNVVGTRNALEAAADAGVETFVFASTNHVVGMYEVENAPDIYHPDFDLTVDHTGPVRPDSPYGASKVCGEGFGRYYAENRGISFYAIRICSVRDPEYDHPYGDAERGVDRGDWERGSEEYEKMVARMKAMWHSRRDLAHMVECCLDDGSVTFDIFYGVSDNDPERRWFDLDHAREVLGYDPQDSGEEWDAPPER